MPTITMGQSAESINQSIDDEENLIDMLPGELWEIIFFNVYCDENACDGYVYIPDAIDSIKQKLPSISKNIRLVCRAFNLVNDAIGKRNLSKEVLKKFYRSLLIKKIEDFNHFPELENFLKIGNDNGIISKVTYEYLDYSALYGSSKNFNKLITMVLFYGANVNSKDNSGSTAMRQALKWCYQKGDLVKEVIIVLLAHGADVNLQDENGNTALHHVVSFYDFFGSHRVLEIIKILLEHGADLNIKNNSGDTSLAVAERGSFYDLKQFLRSIKDKNVEEKPRTCILM